VVTEGGDRLKDGSTVQLPTDDAAARPRGGASGAHGAGAGPRGGASGAAGSRRQRPE